MTNTINSIEISNDPVAEDDLVTFLWKPIIEQNMVLVCYREGSDEIVGLNMNYVSCKDEHCLKDVQRQVKSDLYPFGIGEISTELLFISVQK